jgi:hypothetical protein
MATALYDTGRKAFADGDIDLLSDTIKVTLIDTNDYTVNLTTHDTVLTAVIGDPSEALIIWKDTGNEATSQLIAYIDNYAGLTVTPNGEDINIAWDNGSNKIFKL